MAKENESLINVPLDDQTKAALVKVAKAQNRATGRQAAEYIKAGLAAAKAAKRSA